MELTYFTSIKSAAKASNLSIGKYKQRLEQFIKYNKKTGERFIIDNHTKEKSYPLLDAVYYVNVYETGRGYGGPEEGGWWFDFGIPTDEIPNSYKCFSTEMKDLILKEKRDLIYELNKGRYPPESTANNSDWLIVCTETHKAKCYPEYIPRYE